MNYGRMALISAAALALAAGCRGRADQQYYDALPTTDGLTLEVTGDASEASAALKDDDIALAVAQSAVTDSEYLGAARNGVRAVNNAVHAAFDHVQEIVKNNEGKPLGTNAHIYGPFDRGNVTYQLTVRKFTRLAFGFKLEAKPLGAEDSAYLVVLGGAIQRAEEAHQGRGVVGINLDNLKLADSSFPGQGKLLAGFAHRPEGKALAFAARAFTPDTTEHDPVSAAFVGWRRNSDNGTAVRLATKVDLQNVENNTAAKELVALRARWIPGTGGHAAAIARGGDIPDGIFYAGRACWDATEHEVFKIVRKCVISATAGTPPDCSTIVFQSGNRTACTIADSEVPEPNGDIGDTTMETGTPVTDGADAPADVPSGDSAL